MAETRPICISKTGGPQAMCGRVKAFGELLARKLDQAEAMATIQGRKVCSRCAGAWNVAKAQKTGVT